MIDSRFNNVVAQRLLRWAIACLVVDFFSNHRFDIVDCRDMGVS